MAKDYVRELAEALKDNPFLGQGLSWVERADIAQTILEETLAVARRGGVPGYLDRNSSGSIEVSYLSIEKDQSTGLKRLRAIASRRRQ